MFNTFFTLHAHLPFVRHIEYASFLEENWYFEALNETYLPFLSMVEKLRDEGYKFNLSFSTSATLNAMFKDEALSNRFIAYLEKQKMLGLKEIERTKGIDKVNKIAKYYYDRACKSLDLFQNKYNKDIISALKVLNNEGYLNLITTAATSAHLPLYKDYEYFIRAQVKLAVDDFYECFNQYPKGFFLPNCGYYQGVEKILDEYGIKYFHVSAQAFFLAATKAKNANFAPAILNNGLYALSRDFNLSSLIWSSTEGYPTDKVYREFYRDIGYDLPLNYISDFIQEDGSRIFTGYKYYAITSNTDQKELYDIDLAKERAKEHARNFIYEINKKAENLKDLVTKKISFSLSFDAELFGHWWFEGLWFLEEVIRNHKLNNIDEYLKEDPKQQVLKLAPSSWGRGGLNQTWLNRNNLWIYPQIHSCIEKLSELASRFSNQKSVKQRFLNEAARVVLLMSSSDWALILANDPENYYANMKIKGYLDDFNLVYENMCKNSIDTSWIINCEKRDVIFPEIDYNLFK